MNEQDSPSKRLRRLARCIAAGALVLLIPFGSAKTGGVVTADGRIQFLPATSLPAEFRDVFEPMLDYDRFMYPERTHTIDAAFSVALVDLDGSDPPELAIVPRHRDMGTAPHMDALLARRTAKGWRYFGLVAAAIDQSARADGSGEGYSDQPAIYLEAPERNGWRSINTGPKWIYRHLSGEVNKMGGLRVCWTDMPRPTMAEPDIHTTYGLIYDSGGPGYFNVVEFGEDCP